jgi:hypothetical protein
MEGWETKLTGLFVILAIVSFIYCAAQEGSVRSALIDSFPPELQDEMTAKFALHSKALRRSTPLPIQEKYVSSLIAGAIFGLCLSLTCFSAGEVVGGWALFGVSVLVAGSAIKSWRTYKKNVAWQAARDDQEEA